MDKKANNEGGAVVEVAGASKAAEAAETPKPAAKAAAVKTAPKAAPKAARKAPAKKRRSSTINLRSTIERLLKAAAEADELTSQLTELRHVEREFLTSTLKTKLTEAIQADIAATIDSRKAANAQVKAELERLRGHLDGLSVTVRADGIFFRPAVAAEEGDEAAGSQEEQGDNVEDSVSRFWLPAEHRSVVSRGKTYGLFKARNNLSQAFLSADRSWLLMGTGKWSVVRSDGSQVCAVRSGSGELVVEYSYSTAIQVLKSVAPWGDFKRLVQKDPNKVAELAEWLSQARKGARLEVNID